MAVGRFIPLRRRDILRHILDDRDDDDVFSHTVSILSHMLRFQALDRADRLKDAYAPFDPDRSTADGKESPSPKQFLHCLEEVTGEANFQRLGHEAIDQAFAEKSLFPLDAIVDMDEFQLFRMYSRGSLESSEKVRNWKTLWKWKEVRFMMFDRLVLVMQMQPEAIGRTARTREMDPKRIYLKSFKNVPHADVEMVLPNTRLKMRPLDRLLTLGPLVIGIGITLYKSIDVVMDVLGGMALADAIDGLTALGPILIVIFGYLWRTHNKIKTTRLEYMQTLSQGLYFRNLGNNAIVLDQLIARADEEEAKEAVLAYHLLTAGPMTTKDLDARAEAWIRRKAGRQADFDVHDGLDCLKKLGLASKRLRKWRAVPPEEAARILDKAWDNAF